METILNISAIVALILPILLILGSLRNRHILKRIEEQNQRSTNKSLLSDPSKEALVSIFTAKKALRETIRIVFEKYRSGSIGLKSPPDEAEVLAQLLLFAIYNLQSNKYSDIMSSLQTLAALGTESLLEVLDDDLKVLAKQWESNIRVNRMIQKARQRMSDRLEGPHTMGLIVRPAKLAEIEESVKAREDEDPEALVKISY